MWLGVGVGVGGGGGGGTVVTTLTKLSQARKIGVPSCQ